MRTIWFWLMWLVGALALVCLFATSQTTLELSAAKPQAATLGGQDVLHKQWSAARTLGVEGEVDRVFLTFKDYAPFLEALSKDGGYAAFASPMHQCMKDAGESLSDKAAERIAQCGASVIAIANHGERALLVLKDNPSVVLKAQQLFGHTEEWVQTLQLGDARIAPILANCLNGDGDKYSEMSANVMAAVGSLVQGTMPVYTAQQPEQCAWYAVQLIAQTGSDFVSQFTLDDSGVAHRLPLRSAGTLATRMLAGNLLSVEKKIVLKQSVPPKEAALALLEASIPFTMLKLSAVALKAMSGVSVASKTAVALGSASIGKSLTLALAPTVLKGVLYGGGIALVLTHPTQVGKYVGKPIAQVFGLPEFVGSSLGWLIIIYLTLPLWRALYRVFVWGYRRSQRRSLEHIRESA
jgi:hypothetical protein